MYEVKDNDAFKSGPFSKLGHLSRATPNPDEGHVGQKRGWKTIYLSVSRMARNIVSMSDCWSISDHAGMLLPLFSLV